MARYNDYITAKEAVSVAFEEYQKAVNAKWDGYTDLLMQGEIDKAAAHKQEYHLLLEDASRKLENARLFELVQFDAWVDSIQKLLGR